MRKIICAAQILICAALLLMQSTDACSTCSTGHVRFVFAAAGFVFYLSLFAYEGISKILPLVLLGHTMLIIFFQPCNLCIVSYCLLLLLNLLYRNTLATAICVLAVAIFLLTRFVPQEPPPEMGLIAFLKNNCPYCERFEREYAPKLRERGLRVVTKTFPEVPTWVERFPTIVCYNRSKTAAIFSGLPELDQIEKVFE